jgi:hypothetical protein
VKDKYDDSIDYLVDRPWELESVWANASNTGLVDVPSCLFDFCARRSDMERMCGCLTMVRKGDGYVVDGSPELTLEVRNDQRLPCEVNNVVFEGLTKSNRRQYLQPFAEWQRRFDRELPTEPDLASARSV